MNSRSFQMAELGNKYLVFDIKIQHESIILYFRVNFKITEFDLTFKIFYLYIFYAEKFEKILIFIMHYSFKVISLIL